MVIPPDLQRLVETANARIRFGYPWWLRLILIKGVAGITLGRRIYLAPQMAGRQLERLLRHELMHVIQIGRHGVVTFYWRYIVEYVTNRRAGLSSLEAYRNISFEKEALSAEDTV